MDKEIQSDQNPNTSGDKAFEYIKAKIPKSLKAKLDQKFDEAVENGTHVFKGDFFGEMLVKADQPSEPQVKEVEVEKEVKNAVNTWLIVGVILLVVVVIGLIIALVRNSSKTKALTVEIEKLKATKSTR